jgi:glycosyltransferase involved in cell wall biosynthesis
VNVGYYFHVLAVFQPDGTALVPAHYGIFVEEIARQAGSVTFFAHDGKGDGTETMRIGGPDVRCVSLGSVRAAPFMAFRPKRFVAPLVAALGDVDVMLLRGPSGLLPAIERRCRRAGVPVVALLVADWRNWRPMVVYPSWRNRAIQAWHRSYFLMMKRASRHMRVLAISQAILDGCGYPRTAVVLTSSLSEEALATLEDLPHVEGPPGVTRLLFTGRMVEEKGLFELVEAVRTLEDRGHEIDVTLVGYTSGDTTIDHVLERAKELGVKAEIHRPGFLPAGPELLSTYRRADIYVLATYGEGAVPRTVKEAFAAGLPVVTTTVPAIAEFLVDGDQALLVPPRDPGALADALDKLIRDPDLAAALAARGRTWVQGWTNEASTKVVVDHLRDEVERQR